MTQELSSQALLDVMRHRRSIRRFEDRPVPDALLEHLLEAARWAPSAHNRQPWRFVVIRSARQRRLLADRMAAQLAADLRASGVPEDAIAADTGRSQRRIVGAPLALIVGLSMQDMDLYPDERRQAHEHTMAVQSAAMAAQNILLVAHAVGLGACWLCAPLFCPDVVVETLALPADLEPQGLIILGYPAETPDRSRQPIESRVIVR